MKINWVIKTAFIGQFKTVVSSDDIKNTAWM